MNCPRSRVFRRVAYTKGTDPGRNFFGGPGGNLANVGLLIPAAATVSQNTRYLARLAAVEVPLGHTARVTSIRQLLTIAGRVPIQYGVQENEGEPPTGMETAGDLDSDPLPGILLEREVKAPFWSFPDGNVIWYLRQVPITDRAGTDPTAFFDGYDRNRFGLDPAICYLTLPIPGPYVPPANGLPPGDGISEYGCWYDMRFPWYSRASNQALLDLEVTGPCVVALYASIWQCDAANRPRPALAPGPEIFTSENGLEDEDNFWMALTDARYHRIGGELTVEYDVKCRCEER